VPGHRVQSGLLEVLADALGQSEVEDLDLVGIPDALHEDVARLEIAMEDAFLVGVLDTVADLSKELEPITQSELMVIAVARDGASFDKLHDHIGGSFWCLARVEDSRDARVVHGCESAALEVEAPEQSLGREVRADELDGDALLDRLRAPSEIDRAHAAFADLLEEFVGADTRRNAGHGIGTRMDGAVS
jgi:hypothetical protein